MRIELDYDECRFSLAKAIEEKTKRIHGDIDPDNCCFRVEDGNGSVVDVAELSFVCDV